MDNNTRALLVKLIQANPGATDEKLRKAFVKKIRASPIGHLINPGKLVDDGVDWDAWRAAIRQVRKGARKRSRATRPAGQGPWKPKSFHSRVGWVERSGAKMIDSTEEEISFLRKLERLDASLVLQGNMALLKIDRLIPDYITCESTSVYTAVFTITERGRQLLQTIDRHKPR